MEKVMFSRTIASLALISLALQTTNVAQAELPKDRWETLKIDNIEIGYGLQIDDVNGDNKLDIILADKSTIQWYENPTWQKHVIARDLTERDNVCIATKDIDGDVNVKLPLEGNGTIGKASKTERYIISFRQRIAPGHGNH